VSPAPRSSSLVVAEGLALLARTDDVLRVVLSHAPLCACVTCEANADRVGELIERLEHEARAAELTETIAALERDAHAATYRDFRAAHTPTRKGRKP